MDFVKMEGLGNDFVVVEGPATISPGDVVRWCDRRYGIGADGVIEATPGIDGPVRMRYWNADGSAAEMCGNGLRCVALLAFGREWVDGRRFVVATPAGDRPVEVLDRQRVRVMLGSPQLPRVERLQVGGFTVHPVGMGNPHAVLFVDDPETAPVTEIGPRIERDPIFPGGTNVEFAAVRADDRVELRVWERGVGETLACGSGAAATAFLAHHQGSVGARSTVQLRGGELVVEIDGDDVWIEGPARAVFDGRID